MYRLVLLTSFGVTNVIHVLLCSIITHNKWDRCTEYIQQIGVLEYLKYYRFLLKCQYSMFICFIDIVNYFFVHYSLYATLVQVPNDSVECCCKKYQKLECYFVFFYKMNSMMQCLVNTIFIQDSEIQVNLNWFLLLKVIWLKILILLNQICMTEIPLTFCIVDKVLLIIPLVVFFSVLYC